MSKKIILVILIMLIIPIISSANGGDQRVVQNKYLIGLSRAPFTPKVGAKTSFLASFVDIQKNKLISEDLIVQIRISELGEAMKGKFIFEQKNIALKTGVADFSYTFKEAGLHEIFFDFAFASNPEKIYNSPDFLIDVQKSESSENKIALYLLVIASSVAGLIIGVSVDRLLRNKKNLSD